MRDMSVKLYAGTVGWGVWESDDLGDTWSFAFTGLYMENRTWALSAHDQDPGVVWAGTDRGLQRRNPDGQAEHVPSPADEDGRCIWSVAQRPDNAKTILIGTHPGAVFRSDDGGGTWRQLPIGIAKECPYIGPPRITRIRFDPFEPETLWVSVEIDGVHRSRDGGETWQRIDHGFDFPDFHDLAVVD